MSSKEYDGTNQTKLGCFRTLSNMYTYSCPHMDNTYKGISKGINCLCKYDVDSRTIGDLAVITGKKWPVSNDRLGWKV